MIKSAGLLIIYEDLILLCHPTNAPWKGSYSIPKGKIEEGEDSIDAAIRETKEEIGFEFDKSLINKSEEKIIEYKNKQGKTYKKVYYFPIILEDMDFINHQEGVIPKNQLQIDEVDWAGFLDLESAKEKIFWRFEPMLEYIKH